MKAVDIMPSAVVRDLRALGKGIAIARRRRRIPVALMLERTGLAKRTYQFVEKGDPRVSMAAYAISLFALGLSGRLSSLADPQSDQAGLLFEEQRLPQRVRTPKAAK